MIKLVNSSFLIFITVISLAIILAILFYFTYSEIERSAKDVALGEIQNVSSTQTFDSGKIIENALMDIVTNLKTIANSPTVQQSKEIKDHIILMNAAQSSTYNITDYYRIIDKNGKMIATSDLLDNHQQYNKSKYQDFSNKSYFTIPKEKHKIYVSNLINLINNVPGFSISVPIFDRTIFNGVIEASVRIDKLEKLVQQSMLLSQQNEIILVDRNGTIMFTTKKDVVGESFFSDKVIIII